MPVTILVQLSHMLISFQFIGIHKHFLQDNLVHGEGAFASLAMSGKNRLLVTDELVEVQDFKKTTDHFRGIYGMYLKLIKEKIERCQHATSWTWKH